MTSSPNLDQMTPEQLRGLAEQAMQLLSQVDSMSQKIQRLVTVNEQLQALVLGLPWQRVGAGSEITVL